MEGTTINHHGQAVRPARAHGDGGVGTVEDTVEDTSRPSAWGWRGEPIKVNTVSTVPPERMGMEGLCPIFHLGRGSPARAHGEGGLEAAIDQNNYVSSPSAWGGREGRGDRGLVRGVQPERMGREGGFRQDHCPEQSPARAHGEGGTCFRQ